MNLRAGNNSIAMQLERRIRFAKEAIELAKEA